MYTPTNSGTGLSKCICFAFLFFSFLFVNAQGLAPETEAKLIDHLTEINKLWATQEKEIPDLNKIISFRNDDDRIQTHFLILIQHLKQQDISQLNTAQKTKRFQHLLELEKYALQKQFPQNSFHPCRQPYFVDKNDTHCAVAHLVKESGDKDLVLKIRSENNYAYVSELLSSHPELGQWAQQNGFTATELKWIQPNYNWPVPHQEMYPVGNGGGTDGHINVMETSPGGSRLYMAGNFTEVDGISANSIIAWDGIDWHTLGNGVDGEIYDLHWHKDRLHIAGNFKLFGEDEYTSIAYWNSQEWIPLQQGYTGNIYTMTSYKELLYIGGAFEYLNEIEMPFLAYYDENTMTWANHSWVIEGGDLIEAPDVFTVDDTVRCFTIFEDILYVGGDFSTTAPDSDFSIFQKESDRFAKWAGNNWMEDTHSFFDQITDIVINDSFLIFCGMHDDYPCRVNDYQMDNEPYYFYYYWAMNEDLPGEIHGHFQHDGFLYFYGNIYASGWYQHRSVIPSYGTLQAGDFNDYVRAATVFQNNIYFAGAFTEAFDVPLNGLAFSAWGGNTVSTNTIDQPTPIKVYTAQKQLNVEYENLQLPSSLLVYNIQGQLLKSLALSTGMNQLSVDINEWPTGAYAYQLVNSESRSGGKFFVQ